MDKSLNSDLKIVDEQERDRVNALKRYQILDTAPEQSFDNLAKLATQFFNLPISSISFIDTENAFVKAVSGVQRIATVPREKTLCALAIKSDDVLVLEDLGNLDPCLFIDPVFIAELGFKFYAGAPLITHDGFRIGTLCIIGAEKREFTLHEADLLKSLARITMDEIELRIKGIVEAEQRINTLTRQLQDKADNQAYFEKAPIALGILKGKELIIESANEKILEVWGKTEDVIGKPIQIGLPELEGQHFLEIMENVLVTGIAYYGYEECAFLLRDEIIEEVYFNFVYQPLKDQSGNVLGIMIVATEITAQIIAKKKIEFNEKQLESTLVKQLATNELLSQTVEDLALANSDMKIIHDELTLNYKSLKKMVQELAKADPRIGDLLN